MARLYMSEDEKVYTYLAELPTHIQQTPRSRFLVYKEIGFYFKNNSSKKHKCTKRNEAKYFSNLYEFISNRRVIYCDEISYDLLLEYKNNLCTQVAAPTVNRQFRTYRNFFNILFKLKKIPDNPTLLIKPEPEKSPKVNLWTPKDLVRAKRSLEPDVWNIIYFMWHSGARSHEAVNLLWTDIDWDRRLIYLHTNKVKGLTRVIPLTEKISKVLHQIPVKGIHVFTDSGRVFTSDSLGKKVKIAVLENCENKNLTVKDLRHTYCTRAIEVGLSNKTVQDLLGHSSWRTTEKYSHLSKKHLKNSAELI